jgi:hypothetical protein
MYLVGDFPQLIYSSLCWGFCPIELILPINISPISLPTDIYFIQKALTNFFNGTTV